MISPVGSLSKSQSKQADLAHVSYAECLNEQQNFADARRELRGFLEQHPRSAYTVRVHFAQGWAAENLGTLDEAIEHYKKATGDGTVVSAKAQFQIGQCLAAKKEHKDAIVEFLQIPSRYGYPEWSSRALLQVAGCFEALEEYQQSRKYYGEVIQRYPKRDEARLARERIGKLPE